MGGYGASSMMFIERESSVYSVVWLEYQKQWAHVNAAAFRLTDWALLGGNPVGQPSSWAENTGSGLLQQTSNKSSLELGKKGKTFNLSFYLNTVHTIWRSLLLKAWWWGAKYITVILIYFLMINFIHKLNCFLSLLFLAHMHTSFLYSSALYLLSVRNLGHSEAAPHFQLCSFIPFLILLEAWKRQHFTFPAPRLDKQGEGGICVHFKAEWGN